MSAESFQYRRGAIMGLTVAESFMLITFLLLMLLALWRIEKEDETAWLNNLTPRQISAVAAAARDGGLDTFIELRKAGMDQASTLSGSTLERVTVPSARLAVIEERARLVSEEDIRQLAEAAAALDPDERRKLTDLVKLDEFRQAIERLNALKDVLAGKSVDEIAKALDMAEAAGEEGLNDADALRERIRTALRKRKRRRRPWWITSVTSLEIRLPGWEGRSRTTGLLCCPTSCCFRSVQPNFWCRWNASWRGSAGHGSSRCGIPGLISTRFG